MDSQGERPLGVLVVEDNAVHADLIRRHLEKVAKDTVAISRAERLSDALARMRQGGIDAVLLDLGLPDSPVPETLSRVIQECPDVPIVVLTSLDDLEFAAAAVQQGAQDYLVKSDLDGRLLLRSVRYAVERKKGRDRLESYAAELERSNEHLKGFAHTVAHEVKSPLCAVRACLELLESQYGGQFDHQARRLVRDAQSAVEGLADLVNELLELARVGSAEQDFTEVDVEAVFYQAYTLLRSTIKRTRSTVTHDPLPVVRGNEVQIRHLLQNLIANAIKYRGADPPEIHVAAEESPDRWTFSVRDNGMGIPREVQASVFEVFVRLHGVDEIPGTGIGLALCKRIVQHHGGQIWVESVSGEGSTFSFTLPKPTPSTAPQGPAS